MTIRTARTLQNRNGPIPQNWLIQPLGLLTYGAMVVVFLLLLSYTVSRWRATTTHPLRAIDLQGEWICAPGDEAFSGYFRKRFDLSSPVKHAWMCVSAKDGFEVAVNRNPVGRYYLWRPTRPFQNGCGEKGQAISHRESALALNFPREYQWDGHNNWQFPTYIEFTNSLKAGKNIICVDVESRSLPASVNFYGEIVLANGDVIPIRSGPDWRAEPVPLGPQVYDWTEPGYWDVEWRKARRAPDPPGPYWRTVPERIYTQPFAGQWMQAGANDLGTAPSFTTRWFVGGPIDEAWLRIIANRRYVLMINGRRVELGMNRTPDLDQGEWVLGRHSGLDPVALPELLDPDETSEFFVGEQFENPRDAQTNLNEFKNLKPKTHLPFRNYRTTNRAEDGGEFDPTRTLAESRRTPDKPDSYPERPIPNALKRDRATGGYLAYSVAKLLRPGWNDIAIRTYAQEPSNWPAMIAVDGAARTHSGTIGRIPAAANWHSVQRGEKTAVSVRANVDIRRSRIPALQYRGVALDPVSAGQRLGLVTLSVFKLGIPSILLLLLIASISGRRRGQSTPDSVPHTLGAPNHWLVPLQWTFVMMLCGATTMLCGVLWESSLQERHEVIWFHRGYGWLTVLATAGVMGCCIGVVDAAGRCQFRRLRVGAWAILKQMKHLPDTRVWPFAIVWVLLLATVLRGYKLDLQPLDDDEYASTQAIVAILETGTPKFVPDDVYYTRSPLFHYVTAAIAYPWGANLWSLRWQSVAWSLATMLLCYFCGSRLLGSRWIGFVAMTLLAIHPFEVFTGHVIRFYQMQQFFALLTVFLFCRGFVYQQQQSYRIATIGVFLAAVLSQEISAVMGVPLLIGFVLFAKDLGWQKNIQLMLIAACAMCIIALDFLAFKTLCLTRTEGVSPTIEAAIKPHFWYPLNLFSIFLGYSRLHIVPSFFLLVGLPFLWRKGNRNTLALVVFLLSGVLMTNLLVSHVSLRYQYWLFPIWILVCLECVRAVLNCAVGLVYDPTANPNRFTLAVGSMWTVVVVAIVMSWSPARIPGTYEMRLLGDSTGCVRWVRANMLPGDRLAITEPHTHTAYLESGEVDYDVAVPLLYDFAVVRDGRMVDRNGGGELVSSVDQLISVLEKQDRVWILLNREKFRTRGKNMRWEYPGARFEMFLRKNCELKHRTYLWHAYLWDAHRGHYVNFSKQQ